LDERTDLEKLIEKWEDFRDKKDDALTFFTDVG